MTESIKWHSNIVNDRINRIIALSDIHGDMHALIIAFRDCAQIIRKKPTVRINLDILDEDAERLLEMDLNKNEDDYKDDLNYEWCGGNTHVVICGDMIDPYRNSKTNLRTTDNKESLCFGEEKCIASEYYQIELKILRFINALNKQAMAVGGRIFKILGNHEINNMVTYKTEEDPISYQDNYIAPVTRRTVDYYRGLSRNDIFHINNYGANILL